MRITWKNEYKALCKAHEKNTTNVSFKNTSCKVLAAGMDWWPLGSQQWTRTQGWWNVVKRGKAAEESWVRTLTQQTCIKYILPPGKTGGNGIRN